MDSLHPKYPWFQRPAPGYVFTFIIAAVLYVLAFYLYRTRVNKIKQKFDPEEWKGSLRVCAKISAYMDHHEDPAFAILRLCTKAFLFLGFMQLNYQVGFLIMLGCLVVESSLDTIRVLLAVRNCKSLSGVSVIADDETHDLRDGTKLEPTNVYEDLTRPRSIAVMVFAVQVMLIGLVLDDSYRTTTRTCFNGTDGCLMLTSLGSYSLYLMGTFMACVFYVGPRNSYGKKEQNPTFWLKLFLMSKESSLTFSYTVKESEQVKTLFLEKDDWRIWARFGMSAIVNGAGFHFLLHVLPVQVASMSVVLGVVFRAVGMIYLVDLDDTAGSVMTVVPDQSLNSTGTDVGYGTSSLDRLDAKEFEEEKRKIIEEAMKDVQAKLEALACGARPLQSSQSSKMGSITQALFRATQKHRKKAKHESSADEEKPLV